MGKYPGESGQNGFKPASHAVVLFLTMIQQVNVGNYKAPFDTTVSFQQPTGGKFTGTTEKIRSLHHVDGGHLGHER